MQIPFSSSPRSSLGVEWELELVDLETRELASGRAASEILAELGAPHGGEHPKAKHELLESCIEIITGVCGTVREAERDLHETLTELDATVDSLLAVPQPGLVGSASCAPARIRSPTGRRS